MNSNYKDYITNIKPDNNLIFDTKRKMREAVPVGKRTFHSKRAILAAVFVIVVLMTSITGVAATNGIVLSPIHETSVYDGIELTVTDFGMSNDGDEDIAEVHFTMRDLDGKGRINETTDPYNRDITGFNAGTCYLYDYDTKTQTGTFCMEVTQFVGKGIKAWNHKGRINVTSFLKDVTEREDNTGVNLTEALNTEHSSKTERTELNGEAVSFYTDENYQYKHYQNLLKKDELNIPLPSISCLKLTNIGYVDNMLHIQFQKTGPMKEFNHFVLYLKNANDEKIECRRILFSGDYEEYEFTIDSNSSLEDYQLCGIFWEYGEDDYIEGSWEVVFGLK